jgi:hypothetical protein
VNERPEGGVRKTAGCAWGVGAEGEPFLGCTARTANENALLGFPYTA